MKETEASSSQTDFLLIEYQVASEQYRSGVDLGLSTIKALITLNGLLLAAVAAVTQSRINTSEAQYIIFISAMFGFIISAFTASILPYYFMNLSKCENRCKQIEEKFGGLLYTTLIGDSKSQRTRIGLFLVCSFFAAVWIFIFLAVAMNRALFDSVLPPPGV